MFLLNTVFYLKLNFKLKIDPKMCPLKKMEEILNKWKKIEKTSGNPVCKLAICKKYVLYVCRIYMTIQVTSQILMIFSRGHI